ncbi:hypothetical protein HYALB_00013065 [Hymenoscyphus albidus]|uniref:Uncharacterized protein n=1 Tax=Hymenoscyphus albidus TaxID=595503 RepID=A0A9N9QA30_9HELO|nr:hypothetical protein HYALB_00013065 [Hymenoscyphus albidus]
MVSAVEFVVVSIGIATVLLALGDIVITRRHRTFYKFDMEKLPLPALVRHNGQPPIHIASTLKPLTNSNFKHQHFE